MRMQRLLASVLIKRLDIQKARLLVLVEQTTLRLTKAQSSTLRQKIFAISDRRAVLNGQIAEAMSTFSSLDRTNKINTEIWRCEAMNLSLETKQFNAGPLKDLSVLANIYLKCEIAPIQTMQQRCEELSTDLKIKSDYLALWIAGETSAPAIEVLLYVLVPASDLQYLVGDLQEEYVCKWIPQYGPRAAEWKYTRQVMATVGLYAGRALKRTLAVSAAADGIIKLAHLLAKLF